MKAIRESSEHHFLTTLTQLQDDAAGWVCLYFPLSKSLRHDKLVADLSDIPSVISTEHAKAEAFFGALLGQIPAMEEAFAYIFPDHDVLVLARPQDQAQQEILSNAYQVMHERLRGQPGGTGSKDRDSVERDFYGYKKLAEDKLMSGKRMEAYQMMADENRVSSIGPRRKIRDDVFVLVVEDDRFTAAYTTNILNKEFDVEVARDGAEAISAYIEHAPDIVLLDIHLPCLDGLEVLAAIRAVDPQAHVVMLSVDASKKNITEATGMGAHKFLKKPFSKERILDCVRESPFVTNKLARR